MRCNPLRWVWGLIPVLGLSALAVALTHADIESELKTRVDDQLRGSGFKWARTAVSGRDVVLNGTATDDADPARAYDIARSLWGVRTVDNQAAVIEKVDVYEWSAVHEPGKLALGGFVPNDGARDEILKTAKRHFPTDAITDGMKLARGSPAQGAWLAAVNFGLKQIAALKTGEARLKGLALSMSGEAADPKSYTSVRKALASELPSEVKLVDARILAPVIKPFVWNGKQSGGQLVLSGYVPAKARDEVVAAAKAAFPRANAIDDRMEIAEGAGPAFGPAAAALLRSLARLEDGSVEIRDQAVTIQGLATAPDIADSARQDLGRGLPQGYQTSEAIRVRDVVAKPVVPYTTSVHADPGAVLLLGYAPSEIARDRLVQMAQTNFPGRRVTNQLQIAPGAPDGWLRCFEGALNGAGRLGGGKAVLVGRRIDVTAATDDEKLAGSMPDTIKAAIGGDCDTNVRIDVLAEAAPDLVWRAAFNGTDVALDGDVPNAASKSSLAVAAQRAFPGRAIVDRTRIVETKTRVWPLVAEQGLIALAQLQRGEASLSRQQLVVTGQAADRAIAGRVRDQLAQGLAKGYAGRDEITVATVVQAPPPAATPPPAPAVPAAAVQCQNALQDIAREGMIRFERASATLTRESFTTLDQLAVVAKTCPDVTIEIEGHTDSEGTPERNKLLSDRRAQSVVEYLARGGIDAGRLISIGYGDTRPLVPNDTYQNRAKNRRIEFTVKRP